MSDLEKLERIIERGTRTSPDPVFRQVADYRYVYNHVIELKYNEPVFGRPLRESDFGKLLDRLVRNGRISVTGPGSPPPDSETE